jgi:hypothetical protein
MSSGAARSRIWTLVLSASSLVLFGCASLESASSGQIGCAEEDIFISNDESGFGTRTWVATCHGKRFFCSAVGGESTQVSCKEAMEEQKTRQHGDGGEMVRRPQAPPPAAPAQTGCQYDTQCKGDRICDDGECVTPRSSKRAGSADAEAPAAAD